MKYLGIVVWIGLVSTVFPGTCFTRAYAQEQPGIQEEAEVEGEFALTDQPLEIWTFLDDHRLITGKTLHLTVQVMWKLGVAVNLEGLEKINLSPFTIEGVTIGERQIFDNEHDYAVVTYALSLPADIKPGIYSIPSFSLSYRNEVDKTEGTAASAAIAVKKVPILIEGNVDRDVITIGDHIIYTLTVRHEKNVTLLWESIEKLNFSPFEVLQRDIKKTTERNVEKISITYTLSLYELGGKKKAQEIPGLTVLYYGGSPSQSNTAKAGSSLIETQEVKTASIPVILNSLLKAVDVPLEGIKGPMFYSGKHTFFHGYLPMGIGVMLFVFLGTAVVRSVVGRLSPAPSKPVAETPYIVLERLKNTLALFQYTDDDTRNRNNIHNVNKALRAYIGTLIGISNERAQSATTSMFLQYDTQKHLPEEISTIVQTVLKQLDELIFGRHMGKEAVDRMLEGMKQIIERTSLKSS